MSQNQLVERRMLPQGDDLAVGQLRRRKGDSCGSQCAQAG
jgi:hypothetical protein